MTVELRHLRAFLAIAAEGNVTRAAAALHLTQPALTRTLRQLEGHLGVRLVDRSTHHLDLTPAGRLFQAKAAAAVAAVDEAIDATHAGTWPLRLGYAWSALGGATTTLLRRWKREQPATPLELLRVDDLAGALLSGRVDVVLVRGAAVVIPGARTELLTSEARVVALPADSPLAARPVLALADLADQTIAMNPVSGSTTLELWPAERRPARTVVTANTDDWLTAIAAGDAIGVTASSTVGMHPHPGVVYVPLAGAPAIPVRLAWPDPPGHPAVPSLVALAHEVVAA
jgi:DNA-binding transcriptional LysR family regulator